MGKKVALIILGIGILLALVSTQSGSTGARFSDTATSSDNILTGGVWNQADCLVVDASQLCLNPAGKWICCVYITNDCEYDITIDTVRLSWTPDEGELLLKMQIWHYNNLEWIGEAPSGTVLDVDDITLVQGQSECICFFFDSDVHGKTFTIEFTMGDSTSPPPTTFNTPPLTALEETSSECCEACCPESCLPEQ